MTLSWFYFPIPICTAKRRPALILQRDSFGAGLEQTIVAMISSNVARRGHPSRVFISAASREGQAAGVRLDSVVMTDNLVTVLEREIDSTYLKAQQRGRATGATSQRIFRFIWESTTVDENDGIESAGRFQSLSKTSAG